MPADCFAEKHKHLATAVNKHCLLLHVLRKCILIHRTTHMTRRMAYIPEFVALSKQDSMTIVAELRNSKHFLRATSRSTQNTAFIHVADFNP